ncbi:alpha/beta fold hydrolase [Deinococcus yavapaiensis]|uniref:Pimeloyl-ACP methyl ester carboxylesterase n=1 Tax=Deinococcus yavapaiensis KR-236 TaxID=694435 RepID=A0A318S8K2_9DEIO|nr:alpha/beta fold hydrolase [Deinococcus yavapaiensis]PYE54176.1 pimeloyl-ACP methyl ester carboxylesterase [Deinococcus yavapaiensis KR-236]
MKRFLALLPALLFASCAPRAPLATQPVSPPRLPGMTASAYVTVGGEQVYYETGGAGTPVVLVHGIGGGNSGFQWRLNTAALAQEHRLFVLDLPGFGRSPAEAKAYTGELYTNAVRDFLADVVGAPTAVVASSLAGAYVIDIAASSPNLVTKLLLVSPTGLERLIAPPNPGFYSALTRTPLGGVISTFLRGEPGVNFFLSEQVYLDRSLVTPDITKVYVDNLASADKEFPVFSFISQLLNANVTESWPKTTGIPSRIVWGSDDVNTPASGAAAFVRLRPDVQVDVLAGRAIPNDESSSEFNEIARDFLR